MYAVMTNRGAQIVLEPDRQAAQRIADNVNRAGGDVFAWVIEAPLGAENEDMPGRGVLYG